MWLAIITASGPPTCQLVHADRFKDPELQDLHWHSSALGFHIQFSCDYSIAALLKQHLPAFMGPMVQPDFLQRLCSEPRLSTRK